MYEQVYIKVHDWDASQMTRGVRDLSTCDGCGKVLAYCSCPYRGMMRAEYKDWCAKEYRSYCRRRDKERNNIL